VQYLGVDLRSSQVIVAQLHMAANAFHGRISTIGSVADGSGVDEEGWRRRLSMHSAERTQQPRGWLAKAAPLLQADVSRLCVPLLAIQTCSWMRRKERD